MQGSGSSGVSQEEAALYKGLSTLVLKPKSGVGEYHIGTPVRYFTVPEMRELSTGIVTWWMALVRSQAYQAEHEVWGSRTLDVTDETVTCVFALLTVSLRCRYGYC